MDMNPETDGPIDHLDFTPTCSVGHPGGSQTDTQGRPYPPCTAPARFVTDVHDHPQDTTHFWCVHHLTVHALWIQEWTRSTDRAICLQCGHQITEIGDLIYNLLVIDSPRT